MAPRRGGGALEIGEMIYRGAEARLYDGLLAGRRVVVKAREAKPYRHRLLDERLRYRRTVAEARAVRAALEAGVNAPAVLLVDPVEKVIVLEHVEGRSLAELIEEDPAGARRYARELGRQAARLHAAGIAHGDLTTSNVVVTRNGEVFLVDFGLASLGASARDKAVDVHLFIRSLESTHPEHVEEMLDAFLEGYREVLGEDEARKIMELVEEIRLMGRYVEERRRTVWQQGEE